MTVGEREHLEIRRYTPAASGGDLDEDALPASRDEIRQARVRAGSALTFPGIRDAALNVDSRVVEAMLTETEPRLDLNAAALKELDAAGINGGVIDLLVALAYPERFTVQRRNRGGGRSGSAWSNWGGWGAGPSWSGYLRSDLVQRPLSLLPRPTRLRGVGPRLQPVPVQLRHQPLLPDQRCGHLQRARGGATRRQRARLHAGGASGRGSTAGLPPVAATPPAAGPRPAGPADRPAAASPPAATPAAAAEAAVVAAGAVVLAAVAEAAGGPPYRAASAP